MANVGKYLDRFANGALGATSATLRGTNKAVDFAGDGLAAGGKYLRDKGVRATKKTDPSLGNLWTGRKESAWLAGGAWAAAGGYGYMQFRKDTEFAPRTGEVSYGGNAPIMSADGVGNTMNPNQQAPTLSATGNMVFGLHNARKG